MWLSTRWSLSLFSDFVACVGGVRVSFARARWGAELPAKRGTPQNQAMTVFFQPRVFSIGEPAEGSTLEDCPMSVSIANSIETVEKPCPAVAISG